nr:PREDICTED: anthocyanidin 3-O-glucosyltransferase 2-like [Nicotiana tabacum]
MIYLQKKKKKSRKLKPKPKPAPAVNMEKLAEVILIPSPAMGHIAQMLELAKLFFHQNHHLTITVLIMKLPDYIDAVSGPFVDSVAASSSSDRLRFVHLPAADPTPEWGSKTRGHFVYRLVQSQRSHIKDFLISQRSSKTLAGFVVDMLCTPFMDVADEFKIPSYVFFTSPAAFLGLMLHFQFLEDECQQDVSLFKNTDSSNLLSFPSYAYPVPPSVLPMVLVDRDTWLGRFLDFARGYRKAKGIIINTFAELEIHQLDAYKKNNCNMSRSKQDQVPLPPIYPIGPILNQSKSKSESEEAEITNWLDQQPTKSVVLICFGSQGSLPLDQVKQIALALDNCGCRFLWSLRQPPQSNNAQFPGEYTSYSEILPEGFLDRTEIKGKVVGWVPQLKVLSHEAIGGFVSHCGWNSILESIWCGVPIATWPLHSEQQVNAFQLVKEVGVAVDITLDYCERNKDQPMVTADAIEKRIKELMEINTAVREKAKEMKEKSRASVIEGGSSYLSLGKLIDELLKNAAL